jgi:hypothetical protein
MVPCEDHERFVQLIKEFVFTFCSLRLQRQREDREIQMKIDKRERDQELKIQSDRAANVCTFSFSSLFSSYLILFIYYESFFLLGFTLNLNSSLF